MAKSPYTPELREKVAKEYLAGVASSGELANKYNIPSHKTVRTWAQKYKEQGMSAFVKGNGNARYTSEFKIMCVELCISGKMSVDEVVAKYNISAQQILRNWIMKYNANRELKDYCPKREVYMAEARRKTTIEERKEIVEYCIKHHRNYKETASIYDVSYSQVYSWVKKYDADGENALTDKRGRHKSDDEVDELERLRRENIRLKKQLEEKDMLSELLKKVQEFERM
jgi:transposase-like protein